MIEQEKAKYDRIHSVPGYSPGPGISRVRNAVPYMPPGCSVIDFGTGTGDAAQNFMDQGFKVYAVDISDKGLRHEVKLFKASLHLLPKNLPRADWGFCVDVMEHLPTEWVQEALQQMSRKVGNCYFSISTVPDSWGKKINETLHLTVKPGEWWVKRVCEYWSDVLMTEGSSSCEIIARGSKRD
ncbi:MAG: methyltransferase domain-containing protein [Dehalococcoidia bacterium]|jgi:2-polyprenyl-3-methyl-5-hydroxy-6-metoxy-1,4-benzoquinol methylase